MPIAIACTYKCFFVSNNVICYEGDPCNHGSFGTHFTDPADGLDPVCRRQGSGFASGPDRPKVQLSSVGNHPVQRSGFHQHWSVTILSNFVYIRINLMFLCLFIPKHLAFNIKADKVKRIFN